MINFLKRRKVLLLSLLAVFLFIFAIVKASGSKQEVEVATIEGGDLETKVSVTGHVKSSQEVDLGFDRSGKVAQINVKVGDRVVTGRLLASLNISDLLANLDKSRALESAATADLAALKVGSRSEDVDIAKAKYDSALQTLQNKEVLLENTIASSKIKAENAFGYYVDQLFSNPHTANPQLNIQVRGEYEVALESGRPIVEQYLTGAWADFTGARKALLALRDYVGQVALAINDLSPSASLSASTIATYKNDLQTMRTTIETEISNVTLANQALLDAKLDADLANRQYELSKTPARPEDIAAAEARLAEARASVRAANADIAKAQIYAPFAGVITKQDYKLGASVSSSDANISLIDDGALDVEANIPEGDIAQLRTGQIATVTLDAYGDNALFDATVVSIDPAETVIDGVATYKTILHFNTKDERIRSGMTANVEIMTDKRENVLYIPSRMVITKEGKQYVNLVVSGGKTEEREIKTGLQSSDGKFEVLSGLAEGDKVQK